MKRQFPVVYVEWEDSEHDGSWSTLEDEALHQLGICSSIGWLVHENEHRLVVAASISETEIGNKQYIPRKLIVRMKTLRKQSDGQRKRRPKGGSGKQSDADISTK